MLPTMMLLALAWASAGLVQGKVYERCELARELRNQHGFSASETATLVCIAGHQSGYNMDLTSDEGDGSRTYGMFQIKDSIWCGQAPLGCGVACDTLLRDMGAVAKCVRTIISDTARFSGDGFTAWGGAYDKCRNVPYYVADCNPDSESHVCGKPWSRKRRNAPLTVRGTNAARGEFPWHAALFYENTTNPYVKHEYTCGATLVTETALITAAHCVTRGAEVASDFIVVLGTLSPKYDVTAGVHRRLTRFAVHHDYRGYPSYIYDIAVLHVTQPVPFGNSIVPICPANGLLTIQSGERLTVIGWGAGIGRLIPLLASVAMPHVRCPPASTDGYPVTGDKSCLVMAQNGGMADNGDSGGGAMVQHDGKWYLAGVVSTRVNSETIAFTNMSHSAVLPWVNQQLAV